MADMILCSVTGITTYDFLFNNVWGNADFWRFTMMMALFLMILYKKRLNYYEKLYKNSEIDKNIIRKAILIFSEINVKELMNNLLNDNCYSEEQLNKLTEFKAYLAETENDYLSVSLKKSVIELKPTIENIINFLKRDFIKSSQKGIFKLNINSCQESAEDFEYNDKTFIISTQFESKYLNFMYEIKKEFI